MNVEKYFGESSLQDVVKKKLGLMLRDGSVTKDKLASNSVTVPKLADDVLELIGKGGGGGGSTVAVIDNLDSESITAALSANQGRVLKELINTGISAETKRAEATEKANTTLINEEIARAIAAEKVNTDALNIETTTARAAESSNAINIANEITRAKQQETNIITRVNGEIIRATASEKSLSSDIDAETARALAAEETKQTLIKYVTPSYSNVAFKGTNGSTLFSLLSASESSAGVMTVAMYNLLYDLKDRIEVLEGKDVLKVATALADFEADGKTSGGVSEQTLTVYGTDKAVTLLQAPTDSKCTVEQVGTSYVFNVKYAADSSTKEAATSTFVIGTEDQNATITITAKRNAAKIISASEWTMFGTFETQNISSDAYTLDLSTLGAYGTRTCNYNNDSSGSETSYGTWSCVGGTITNNTLIIPANTSISSKPYNVTFTLPSDDYTEEKTATFKINQAGTASKSYYIGGYDAEAKTDFTALTTQNLIDNGTKSTYAEGSATGDIAYSATQSVFYLLVPATGATLTKCLYTSGGIVTDVLANNAFNTSHDNVTIGNVEYKVYAYYDGTTTALDPTAWTYAIQF